MMWPRLLSIVALSVALGALSDKERDPRRGGDGEGAPGARSLDAACAELTPAAARGRRIFSAGRTASGRPIEGELGGGPAALTGADAACAGCHGPGGGGGEEGGVTVPTITPERLAGAADDALRAAITAGRSLSAERLGAAMPRYKLEGPDLEDLLAYLRCVGHDRDPGVTGDAIRLGAALPLTGPQAAIGGDMRAVLSAVFADVNAQGGIFGRRLELVPEDTGALANPRDASPREEEAAAARLIEAGVFALVGGAVPPRRFLDAHAAGEEVPVVAPLGPTEDDAGESVFSLYPGPEALARIAVKQIADAERKPMADSERKPIADSEHKPAGPPRITVVHMVDKAGKRWAKGAALEAARRGLPAPSVHPFEPGRLDAAAIAREVAARGATALLFSGGAEELAACAQALRGARQVRLYAPLGAEGDRAPIAPEVTERVLFVYPGLLGERRSLRFQELFAFLARHGIAPRSLAAEAHAYLGAQVISEALKRAGARPTRRGLLRALETLRDFDAGPAPLLSYGKGRHTGVMGAWLVQVDPAKPSIFPVSAWMAVTP